MANVISWFEIPVYNLERAKRFYQTILRVELRDGGFGDDAMAFFPSDPPDVSGALVHGEQRRPAADGVLVYFEAGTDLNDVLSRVEDAGGRLHVPKTLIMPEAGYFAIFFDTEGNKLGLHSLE